MRQMKLESHEEREQQTRALMEQLDLQLTLNERQTSKIHSPKALTFGLGSSPLKSNAIHDSVAHLDSGARGGPASHLKSGTVLGSSGKANSSAKKRKGSGGSRAERIDHLVRYLSTKSDMFSSKD